MPFILEDMRRIQFEFEVRMVGIWMMILRLDCMTLTMMNSAGIMYSGGFGRELANWVATGTTNADVFGFDIRRFHPDCARSDEWLSQRSHETYVCRCVLIHLLLTDSYSLTHLHTHTHLHSTHPHIGTQIKALFLGVTINH